jgi:outer membrane lipoprotein LolB
VNAALRAPHRPVGQARRASLIGLLMALVLLLGACQTAPVTRVQAGGEGPDCGPSPGAMSQAFAASGSPAIAPPAMPSGPALSLQGQMSLKLDAFGEQAAQGISLGFFFNGRAQAGELALMTLMGSQVAQLRWAPQEAELTDSQGPHRYPSLAALSEAALGEALPLDTLIHWMQGRADPSLPVRVGAEPDTFEQLGWLIDTRQMDEKKLTATRAPSSRVRGARIKVYLDR